MKAMDVHCHFLPQEYVEALKRYGRISEDGFPCPQWSEEMQLEYMEKAQIAHAVLTISSPHPYFGDGAYSAQLCRMLNESAAALARKYPGMFSYAAVLPLPDVERALAEARFAIEQGGACGIKLSSQAAGLYPGDERMEPLLEYLNERHAVLIFHPTSVQFIYRNSGI